MVVRGKAMEKGWYSRKKEKGDETSVFLTMGTPKKERKRSREVAKS
jgi:hypothetical protein